MAFSVFQTKRSRFSSGHSLPKMNQVNVSGRHSGFLTGSGCAKPPLSNFPSCPRVVLPRAYLLFRFPLRSPVGVVSELKTGAKVGTLSVVAKSPKITHCLRKTFLTVLCCIAFVRVKLHKIESPVRRLAKTCRLRRRLRKDDAVSLR